MLRKLLKYEFKATARTFLPLFLALIVFGIINRIFVSPDEFGLPFAISMTLYMFILFGTFVATYIVMIQRFYKNLLKDEGYLMFTLPTETWKHITSKLLISMLWTFLSIVFATLSILIIASKEISLSEMASSIRWLFSEAYKTLGLSTYTIMIQVALITILGAISGTLMIYVSIAIGQLFNQHRILASIGAYFCIYTIIQIVVTVSMAALFGSPFEMSYSFMPAFIQSILWFSVISTAVFSIICFIATNLILSKRLNLE